MIVRPERADDVDGIRDLTAAAFAGHPHSDGSEPFIIDRLRAAGALTLSLVAEDDGILLGHIAFSPVDLSSGATGWYGLGPISVLPQRQRQGIGSALVKAGLAGLEGLGAAGCVLAGDPAYYRRFGFRHDPAMILPGLAPQYFLSLPLPLPLSQIPASGMVTYHPAFAPGTTD